MNKSTSLSLLLVVALCSQARSAEICGNGIDDDANGLTDEGCWNLTSGQCESPLSCGDTGSVSPKRGILRYSLPPDVAPKVPWGPGIGFRRTYLSEFKPDAVTSPWKKPLGDHWQHTYMTWTTKTGTVPSSTLVIHTSQGQDVRAPYASSASGWDYYTPQTGVHYNYVRQRQASPNEFQIRMLTGETLVYNSAGRLTEIWDTLATPNKVLVTYDGSGNLSTVTDASATRRLSFAYSGSTLTTINFQILISSTWTTEHTTAFEYDGGTPTDATSHWRVASSVAQWTALLVGSGIGAPGSVWLLQEASGTLADSIGTRTASLTGSATYQQTDSEWTRKGIELVDNATSYFSMTTPSANTTSLMLVQYLFRNTSLSPSKVRGLDRLGRTQYEEAQMVNGPSVQARSGSSTAVGGSLGMATKSVLTITKLDHSRNELVVYTDRGDVLRPTFTNQSADTSSLLLGDGVSDSDSTLHYAALFTGSAAEISDTQAANLIKRLQSGAGILTKVTIGGQVAQQYAYAASGDLSQITDGGGTPIVTFGFSSTTVGQIDLIDTARGVVGFEYASLRAACSGQTVLYFNKGNTLTCNVDSDCGTGYLCGGKTGSGSTGTCFRGARCLTVSSPSEDVVTTVAAMGPPGEACDGTCADVTSYVWNTTSPALDLKATQDGAGYYVTRAFDSNGLVTKVTYGDTDSDPNNGTSSREEYLFYTNASFPGRVTEIRRKSDLDPNASSCSASVTTGCAQTLYGYDTNGLLSSLTFKGTTLSSTGATTAYEISTTYGYDAAGKGRIATIDGPLTGTIDQTVFEYWTGSGSNFKEGFLQNYKREKAVDPMSGGALYIVTSALDYDFWGNPIALQDADKTNDTGSGTVTCLTFSSARGYMTQRREAMAGQSDCASSNSADLTASFARDSALRLTSVTRPDGSCLFYEYDAKGRLLRTKRRDDCNAASAGDKQEFVYDSDGLVTEIQTYDSSSTLTAKQPFTYFDSRRLARVVNPVDTSKWTGVVYDARGLVNEVDGAGAIGKTVFNRSTASAAGKEGRVTSVDKYSDATAFDTWNLLYDWVGSQAQVTDKDSKATQTVRDDLNRVVKLISADMSYPRLFVYDNASRLTSRIDALGGGSGVEKPQSFTYDYAGRLLNSDFWETCNTGAHEPEIQRVYDKQPESVCPITGGCLRTGGRLAYVKNRLFCSSVYIDTDGSWDQKTYYSYDDAGRVIREDVLYDGYHRSLASGVQTLQTHGWNKLSMVTSFRTSAGFDLTTAYGSAGNNSDSDRVSSIAWSGATVAQNAAWYPFGPLKQYDQMNTIGGNVQRTRIARNLAYRPTNLYMEPTSGGAANFQVAVTEDAKARVTSRVYTGAATGVQNSYFLYDDQDRLLCETTSSVSSCPTSGSNIKNSRVSPYFTAAGDWLQVLRPIPGSTGGLMNSFNASGYGTSHQVTSVAQTDGSPAFGTTSLGYDAQGRRTYDDNTTTLTNDRRDYMYDDRGNVSNVHGKYYNGGAWIDYDVGSAFDHRNRRVFKFFLNNTTNHESNWWFYYDANDRLVEIWYYKDTADLSTYSIFNISWINDRAVAYTQIDYPGASVNKRYVNIDEAGRPIDMWSYPPSGGGTRAWAVNPTAWGGDVDLVGLGTFQPLLVSGQYQDTDTAALENNGSTIHRPALSVSGDRTYDPLTGGSLQVDPSSSKSWSSYVYINSNPVGHTEESMTDPYDLLLSGERADDVSFAVAPEESSTFPFGRPASGVTATDAYLRLSSGRPSSEGLGNHCYCPLEKIQGGFICTRVGVMGNVTNHGFFDLHISGGFPTDIGGTAHNYPNPEDPKFGEELFPTWRTDTVYGAERIPGFVCIQQDIFLYQWRWVDCPGQLGIEDSLTSAFARPPGQSFEKFVAKLSLLPTSCGEGKQVCVPLTCPEGGK